MVNLESLIGKSAALEGLAEECCELAHAALKEARILRGENPTPVSIKEAEKNVTEEFNDVIFYANSLKIPFMPYIQGVKEKRFIERINNER